jgi:peptide/nickel transport system substrate-binding protein
MRQSATLYSAILLLSAFIVTGCSRGGTGDSGGAPAVKLSASDTAGFKKTDVSGKRGGTIVDAVFAGPKTFNILVSKEQSSSGAVGVMFDGLVTRNLETLEIEPALAESYDTSSDGRTWTFKLRPGLKWSDGQPLTADDVTFTLDLIYDPKVDTMSREVLTVDKKPWSYKKIDDHTVQIETPTPFGPFLDVAGFPILPKHKVEAAWKAGKFNSTWGVDTPPSELVGTGPLLLQKFTPDQSLMYRRNPYYWKLASDGQQLPFLDSALTLIVSDLNAVILKFQSKETDTVAPRPEDFAGLKKDEAKGSYRALDLGPTWSSLYLSFNMNPSVKSVPDYKREWFSKKEFRQAVSYALDRKSMIDTVLRGLGRPQWSPVTEANKAFYNPNVKQYPHDPAKAKALLSGLGFADRNGDGILEDKNGHPLEFNLVTNTGNTVRINLCNIVQDDLKQVGMKVNTSSMDFNSLVTRLDSTYDWEAVMLGIGTGIDPHGSKSAWASSGPLHVWNPRQKSPATPWEAEIDQIFSDGAKTIDKSKRKALYDRWQMIASEQLPMVFLVAQDSLLGMRNRLANTKPTALGARWNIEEIYIQ